MVYLLRTNPTLEMVWPSEVLDSLIDYVMKHPFLYDHSIPEYYDRDAVHSSWNWIGQKLGRRGSQVRTMWRQLVKIYTWIHNNEHYKLDDECYWPHLEQMNFLMPFIGKYVVRMNMSFGEELIDCEASMEAGIPVAAFITYKLPMADTNYPENLDDSLMQEDKTSSQPDSPFALQEDKNFLSHPVPHPFPASLNGLTMQKNLEIEEALCQYLRKKVTKEKDPNALFLTSVAHDMKMLSSQDQAVFKMRVQQLLVEMISTRNGGMK